MFSRCDTNIMLFHVLALGLLVTCGGTVLEQECPEGTYMYHTGDTSVCLECPSGTFMPWKGHTSKRCFHCTKIEDSRTEILIKPCDIFHDTEIHCKEGYFRRETGNPSDKPLCVNCSFASCPDKSVLVHSCEKSNDECCPDGSLIRREGPQSCSRGYYLDTVENNCKQCPENTYMSEHNHDYTKCLDCEYIPEADLPPHTVLTENCTSTQPPWYGCQHGFYMNHAMSVSHRGDNISCSPCRSCVGGMYRVGPCDGYHDTKCCNKPNMTFVNTPQGGQCKDKDELQIYLSRGLPGVRQGGSQSLMCFVALNKEEKKPNIGWCGGKNMDKHKQFQFEDPNSNTGVIVYYNVLTIYQFSAADKGLYRCKDKSMALTQEKTIQIEVACGDGTYRPPYCDKNCSQHCNGVRRCDHNNGDCLDGCKEGFTGLTCESPLDNACVDGTYHPPYCDKNCSQHCSGVRRCDHNNGDCLDGCKEGFTGLTCESPLDNGEGSVISTNDVLGWIVGVLSILVVVLLIVLCKYLPRDKNRCVSDICTRQPGPGDGDDDDVSKSVKVDIHNPLPAANGQEQQGLLPAGQARDDTENQDRQRQTTDDGLQPQLRYRGKPEKPLQTFVHPDDDDDDDNDDGDDDDDIPDKEETKASCRETSLTCIQENPDDSLLEGQARDDTENQDRQHQTTDDRLQPQLRYRGKPEKPLQTFVHPDDDDDDDDNDDGDGDDIPDKEETKASCRETSLTCIQENPDDSLLEGQARDDTENQDRQHQTTDDRLQPQLRYRGKPEKPLQTFVHPDDDDDDDDNDDGDGDDIPDKEETKASCRETSLTCIQENPDDSLLEGQARDDTENQDRQRQTTDDGLQPQLHYRGKPEKPLQTFVHPDDDDDDNDDGDDDDIPDKEETKASCRETSLTCIQENPDDSLLEGQARDDTENQDRQRQTTDDGLQPQLYYRGRPEKSLQTSEPSADGAEQQVSLLEGNKWKRSESRPKSVGCSRDEMMDEAASKAERIRASRGNYMHEISFTGEADRHQCLLMCKKNPGHHNFIPTNSFNIEHLPFCYRDNLLVDYVRAMSGLTCCLSVPRISEDRPETWPDSHQTIPFANVKGEKSETVGTGWVSRVFKYTEGDSWHRGSCECHTCSHTPMGKKTWGELYIETASHVVFNTEEARHTKCQFFYDSPETDIDKVLTLTGLKVDHSDIKGDRCEMKCVTHDVELLDRFDKMCRRWDDLRDKVRNKYTSNISPLQRGPGLGNVDHDLCIVVSHPHGCAKQISVGTWKQRHVVKKYDDGSEDITYSYNTPTCPGSGGAPIITLCYNETMKPVGLWDLPAHSEGRPGNDNNSGVGREYFD